jgi:hypothetical protein
MPSISRNQVVNLENGFVQRSGSTAFQRLDLKSLDALLAEYAENYKDALIAEINRKQITASGEMEKNITFTLKDKQGIKVLEIYMVDYAKFIDKGVKGWGSSKNAPSSPYSYKNPPKTDSGGAFRKSITRYIQSGKAKVSSLDVKRYGAIKGEKKSKSLIDARVDTMMYLIRKYGIKTKNFIDKPLKDTFKDLEVKIADEFAVNIAVQITR